MTLPGSNGSDPMPHKKTKILATLGPACSRPQAIKELLDAGVNAFRINCSHASPEEISRGIRLVRKTAESVDAPCAIVLDLQGPRLRVGRLRNGEPVLLKKGSKVRITTYDVPGTDSEISTNFRNLPKVVSKGSQILLDDGSIVLSTLRTGSTEVECEVLVGGLLKEHKGINLPGTDIDLPALTSKDIHDLQLGLKLGVTHVALSFVRSPDEVARARRLLNAKASGPTRVRIIAKIEHPLAIIRIHPILDAADGIMVARGDLAVELSPAEVPSAQMQLIS
ncbi:MAG: hypothetical protein HY549_08435 [Elusimicrobia bacterium]|nr:hypothetical protein [Elusimicrobiota bacterium]